MIAKLTRAGALAGLLWLSVCLPAAAALDLEADGVRQFIDRLHTVHAFDRDYVAEVLAQASKRDSILEAMSRPAEKTKEWHEYRDIFVSEQRIAAGQKFWRKHRAALEAASERYGVPVQIIVAIIGAETNYGGYTGRYKVLDALSTLAFHYPPRSPFFTSELENFFLLSREESINLREVQGSYAGAMGAGQFMPSSYRLFATDGDGDGSRDLFNNWEDIFASVANYFLAHGWQNGAPVTAPAALADARAEVLVNELLTPAYDLGFLRKQGVRFDSELGDEQLATLFELQGKDATQYWVGFNNFHVITRYNRSRRYAMAIYDLSEAIARRVHSDAS